MDSPFVGVSGVAGPHVDPELASARPKPVVDDEEAPAGQPLLEGLQPSAEPEELGPGPGGAERGQKPGRRALGVGEAAGGLGLRVLDLTRGLGLGRRHGGLLVDARPGGPRLALDLRAHDVLVGGGDPHRGVETDEAHVEHVQAKPLLVARPLERDREPAPELGPVGREHAVQIARHRLPHEEPVRQRFQGLPGVLRTEGEGEDVTDAIADRRVDRQQLPAIAEEQLILLPRMRPRPQEGILRRSGIAERQGLDARHGVPIDGLQGPGPLEMQAGADGHSRGEASESQPDPLLLRADDHEHRRKPDEPDQAGQQRAQAPTHEADRPGRPERETQALLRDLCQTAKGHTSVNERGQRDQPKRDAGLGPRRRAPKPVSEAAHPQLSRAQRAPREQDHGDPPAQIHGLETESPGEQAGPGQDRHPLRAAEPLGQHRGLREGREQRHDRSRGHHEQEREKAQGHADEQRDPPGRPGPQVAPE